MNTKLVNMGTRSAVIGYNPGELFIQGVSKISEQFEK